MLTKVQKTSDLPINVYLNIFVTTQRNSFTFAFTLFSSFFRLKELKLRENDIQTKVTHKHITSLTQHVRYQFRIFDIYLFNFAEKHFAYPH